MSHNDPSGGAFGGTPDASGTPLGAGYRLFEVLGRGAMGEVRRGVAQNGYEVAVKLLRPELAADPAMVARFLQERGILVGLAHPNIVRVLDLVAEGPTLAIVMECIRGSDLRTELTRRGTLTPSEAVQLTVGVLRGLSYVHGAGVIHRDIKPENVLLEIEPDGTVTPKLSDFGVSKLLSGNVTSRRTSVIGTPDYMAPELIDDAPPTPASDLYSVGILLYELVCGVPPFAGGSPLAILRKHVELAPGRPTGMPNEIWGLVQELLAKRPEQRPASAGLVATSLEHMLPALAGLPAAPSLTDPPPPDPDGATILNELQPTVRDEQSEASRSKKGLLIGAVVGALVLAGGGTAGALILRNRSSSGTVIADPTPSSSSVAVTASPTASPTDTPTPTDSPSIGESTSPSPSDLPSVTGSGNPTAVLPVLTGKPLSEVVQTLTALGTHYEVVEVLDAKAKDNMVIAQKPAAGQAAGDLVSVSVSRVPVITYLADMGPVRGDIETDPVAVNGVQYTHPIWRRTSCYDSQTVEYDMGKAFRRLQATIGVTDDSNSAAGVTTEIYVDDRRVVAKTTRLGKPVPVSVDVTQGLRLKIVVVKTACTDTAVNVVFADAQLLGLPTAVPSPTST